MKEKLRRGIDKYFVGDHLASKTVKSKQWLLAFIVILMISIAMYISFSGDVEGKQIPISLDSKKIVISEKARINRLDDIFEQKNFCCR